jgi:hypothetical protein
MRLKPTIGISKNLLLQLQGMKKMNLNYATREGSRLGDICVIVCGRMLGIVAQTTSPQGQKTQQWKMYLGPSSSGHLHSSCLSKRALI